MDENLKTACEILKLPGVIVTPTETVMGISCAALSKEQINRVYEIKKRPGSKALIVLVDSVDMIKKYVKNISELELSYLNAEIATTVILHDLKNLPENLVAQDGSLAFRITKHPELTKLITQLGFPIVSTSANISGESTALTSKEVNPLILEAVDYILNLQSNFKPSSKPSRIVKIKGSEVEIIRT